MSNDAEGQAGEEQVDEEMADADLTNGERTTQDESRGCAARQRLRPGSTEC